MTPELERAFERLTRQSDVEFELARRIELMAAEWFYGPPKTVRVRDDAD